MSVNANLALWRAFDWGRTPLGPADSWPAGMRAVVEAVLCSGFPICTVWGDEQIQIYNDGYNEIFGDKHPRSFGAPVRDSWPEIWDFLAPALDQVRRTREPIAFEGMLLPLSRHGAPEECYFDFSYSPLIDGGRVVGVMSVAAQRTEEVVERRRRAVDTVGVRLEGRSVLAALAEALDPLLRDNLQDAASVVLFAAPDAGGAAVATWRLRCEEGVDGWLGPQVGAAGSELVRPVEPAEGAAADRQARGHLVPIHATGRRIATIALLADPLVSMAGHREFALRLRARLQDALHQAQLAAAERERLRDGFEERDALYRFLFDHMDDAAFYTATGAGPQADEMVLAANSKACDLVGYGADELIGMKREQLFFPDDPSLRRAVATRSLTSSFLGDLVMRRKDGTPLPVEISSRLVSLRGGQRRSVSIVRDISRRLALEKERADRARFDAMVELTGGIAHDFNNFLTVILGSLDALQEMLPAHSPERAMATNALLGAERAAGLTDQLLTYAKRQNLQLARIALPDFVREVSGLLASTLGETNTLRLELPQELPPCEVDAAQLTSALLNLAANARDAMREGGILTIGASVVSLDVPERGRDGYELPAGTYVALRAADTGPGIPEAHMTRIFEPFFTSKSEEAGTGLGLPMVQGFVRQSGGDVRVYNQPRGGCCFELLFPIAQGADDAGGAAAARVAANEIVLVVEDNAAVRKQMLESLRRLGFRLLEAGDVKSALAHMRHAPHVDAVVANLALPGGVSGLVLAEEIRARWPSTAIVLTTGGVRGALAAELEASGLSVVRKPFQGRALAQAILAELRRSASCRA